MLYGCYDKRKPDSDWQWCKWCGRSSWTCIADQTCWSCSLKTGYIATVAVFKADNQWSDNWSIVSQNYKWFWLWHTLALAIAGHVTIAAATLKVTSSGDNSCINNNNNNHLPAPPGSNCHPCSVLALFSLCHAISHQAFSIYNINPHQKVQCIVLANHVVGENQLNSPPLHSHIHICTLNPFPNSQYSPTHSYALSSHSHIFVYASVSLCTSTWAHTFNTHSHLFSQLIWFQCIAWLISKPCLACVNVPCHELHSHCTSIELHCSATSY